MYSKTVDALIQNQTRHPALVIEPSLASSGNPRHMKQPSRYHGAPQQFIETSGDTSNIAKCSVKLHDTSSVKSFNSYVKKSRTQTLI